MNQGYTLLVWTSSTILCAPQWPVHLKVQHHNRCHHFAGCFHETLFRTASNRRLCVQWSLHNALQFRPTTYKSFAKRLPNKKGKKSSPFHFQTSSRISLLASRVLAHTSVTFKCIMVTCMSQLYWFSKRKAYSIKKNLFEKGGNWGNPNIYIYIFFI